MHVGAIGGQHKKAGGSRAFLGGVLALATLHGGVATAAEGDCSPMLARVVSIQGGLEVLRANSSQWNQITRLDTPICQGDRLRTKTRSRAALFVRPETVTRIDENTTVAISQSPEGTELEFFDPESAPDINRGSSCGKLYAITRFPKKFKAKSRLVSGSVEGTEFQLAMRCESTELSVFEGKVLAEFLATNAEPVKVSSGESVTAGEDTAETVRLIVNPVDAVQWALYYPPILDSRAQPASADGCRSLEAALGHACFVERADQLLRVGRVDEASAEAQSAIAMDPSGGEAHAILAIIGVVKNDKTSALNEARRATEAAPNSVRAWLALSYTQQAHFDLEAALSSAQQAARLDQGSALTRARVAELLMSLGRIGDAEKEAKLAVDVQPKQSRAHLILGFVHLAQINTKAAKEDFGRSIDLDSSDPLARLGLGLAIIREGHLKEGREELEIAVGLDPTNSLLRSYVGKAYYEESSRERDILAEAQFALAKQFDERDPTPWFYEAILRQSQNRLTDGLKSFQKSIDLNDNRAVFRSLLLLDQDKAARGASLASIYLDAKLDQAAIGEAIHSVELDPSNYSAHQFLAEAYEKTPRHDAARESEYLQAMLRAPISPIVVSPFRGFLTPFPSAFPHSTIASSVTPMRAANNYESLYEKSGLSGIAQVLTGSQDTLSSEFALGAAGDRVSVSGGAGRFRTDGFEPERSATQESGNLLTQIRLTDQLAVQGEHSNFRSDRGVVLYSFDQTFRTPQQVHEESDANRVGVRISVNPSSELLISALHQQFSQETAITGFPSTIVRGSVSAQEAQYVLALRSSRILVGASHLDGISTPEGLDSEKFSYDSAYAYGQVLDSSGRGQLHVGVNQLSQQNFGSRLRDTSPKIGTTLSPWLGANIRFAMFKTARRQFIANETIEPTSFSGFNQFWDDPTGSSAWNAGVGIDQRIDGQVLFGAEVLNRELRVPAFVSSSPDFYEWRDNAGRFYFSRTISAANTPVPESRWSFVLSSECYYDELQRPEDLAVDGIVVLHTSTCPLKLSAFSPSGLTVNVAANYVRRKGVLQLFPGFDRVVVAEEFWTGDLSIDIRLPNRRGKISIGVDNISDQRSRIIDSNDVTMHVPPRNVWFAKISIAI